VSDGYGEGYYKEVSRLAPGLGLTGRRMSLCPRRHQRHRPGAEGDRDQPRCGVHRLRGYARGAAAGGAAQRGYAGKIFQTHGVASEEFIKLGGANVEGAIFTGEAFTIADDLPANDPFRQVRDEFVSSYEKVNGQKPNIFGAHLWDAVTLFKRAAANALKTAKPAPRNSAPRCATSWSAARTST
jgi:branched-chain amino acid transport system substrate-binding protein